MRTNEKATVAAVALGETSATASYHLFPDPNTLHGQTLGAFLRGEKLTTLEARPRLHTTSLTQQVQKLNRLGWKILSKRETVKTADGDRTACVARYSLAPETIAAAGERGKRYAEECARIEAERRAA